MTTLQQTTPAFLHHMRVVSENPKALVEFYERMLDLTRSGSAERDVVMTGPRRAIIISPVGKGTEPYYAYALSSTEVLERLTQRLTQRDVEFHPIADPLFEVGAVVFADPQGRRMVFGVASGIAEGTGAPARLQHTVFQTTELDAVVRFYVEKIGFAISDEVVDAEGRATVVFLRSDDEHHTLAFFCGSKNEWDHHCYETNEWNDIRDWGDRFAAAQVPIFFGPGRHGPGNNLFFMVTDPDGNRLEFSAELQRVASDTAPGVWTQSERTLNSWGRAWMRT